MPCLLVCPQVWLEVSLGQLEHTALQLVRHENELATEMLSNSWCLLRRSDLRLVA